MSQICGAEDIKNCFPYETIKYTDEEGNEATASVEDLKTSEALKLNPDEWLAPAGFISAQGTPFVISLNKSCTRDTEQAMQAIPTNCVQYMYDRNGSNNPNKLDKDIVYSSGMGIAAIAADGGDSKVDPDGTLVNPIGEYKTYYFPTPSIPAPINTCDDTTTPGMGGGDPTYCSNNYWAGAKKACADAGYELPDADTLGKLSCRITCATSYYPYGSSSSLSCDAATKDTALIAKLDEKSDSSGYFWAEAVSDELNYAYIVVLYNNATDSARVYMDLFTICLGK